MRLIDADRSDEIIVFDKQNELLQCSVVRDYCERQREFLNKFPTIDAEPVRHGHWIAYEDETMICATKFVCSACRESFSSSELTDKEFYEMMKHCPNCGVKMDEEVEHEAD